MEIKLGSYPGNDDDKDESDEDTIVEATQEAAERFSTAIADGNPKAIARTLKLLMTMIQD